MRVVVVVKRMKRGEDKKKRKDRDGERMREGKDKENERRAKDKDKIIRQSTPPKQYLNSVIWLILLCYENSSSKPMNIL